MKTSIGAWLAAVYASLALAACSAGGSLPRLSSNSPPLTNPTVEARLTIQVPRRRHGRRARYVSPSTKSIALSLAPNAGGATIAVKTDLTPSADGCTTASGSTICTLTFRLAPGAYTATVDTYDEPNEAGHLLSYGEKLPVTIGAGKHNHVSVVIGGVPHTITVSGGSSNVTGDQTDGFTLAGLAPEPLDITAKDADGNTIVGAGTPYVGHVVSGTGWHISTSPSPATPDLLLLSPASSPSSATLRVSVNYDAVTCALSGVVCSVTFSAKSTQQQYMFVADCNASCGGGSPDAVYAYLAPYTGSPVAKITSGVKHPTALALDASGNLFIANCVNCPGSGSSNTVTVYAPPFTNASSPAKTITTGLTHPVQLVFNAGGDLFAWNCEHSCGTGSGDSIVRYAAPVNGGASPATTITNGLDTVYAIAIGAGDTLLVPSCNHTCNSSDANPDALLAFASDDYGGTPVSITSGIVRPEAIGVDANGNAFVTDCVNCSSPSYVSEVTEYAAPYSPGSAAINTITNGVNGPVAIAVDSGGNLFVGNTGGTADVTEYSSPFTGMPTTYFSGEGYWPSIMTFDGQNDLVQTNYSTVNLSPPPYSSLTPVATGLHFPDAIVFSR